MMGGFHQIPFQVIVIGGLIHNFLDDAPFCVTAQEHTSNVLVVFVRHEAELGSNAGHVAVFALGIIRERGVNEQLEIAAGCAIDFGDGIAGG